MRFLRLVFRNLKWWWWWIGPSPFLGCAGRMVGLDCAGSVSQCELGTLAPVSSAADINPWGNDFTKAMKLLWMPVMFGCLAWSWCVLATLSSCLELSLRVSCFIWHSEVSNLYSALVSFYRIPRETPPCIMLSLQITKLLLRFSLKYPT